MTLRFTPKSFPPLMALCAALTVSACESPATWQLVDNFETTKHLDGWTNIDVDNKTDPFIPNPQVNRI